MKLKEISIILYKTDTETLIATVRNQTKQSLPFKH